MVTAVMTTHLRLYVVMMYTILLLRGHIVLRRLICVLPVLPHLLLLDGLLLSFLLLCWLLDFLSLGGLLIHASGFLS